MMTALERTVTQLRRHYEIERELADRLRGSTKVERARLYGECYDELFRRVPDHPQLVRKADPDAQRTAVEARSRLVRQFLPPHATFMEIGPGDCSLSIAICSAAAQVVAIDVSAEITGRINAPSNFELILSDGSNIPLPDATVDLAFSFQLVEHLHPADATEHAREVFRVLKAGGCYICVTPNRLNGPHDISRYFDEIATGFHMCEYTNRDLIALFKGAGFPRIEPLLGLRGRFLRLPSEPLSAIERVIEALPHRARKRIARAPGLFRLLGTAVLATKST